MGECMKRAVISGVSGQDGRLLSSFLLSKGYKVFGFYSIGNPIPIGYPFDLHPEIELIPTNYLEIQSTLSLIQEINPDEFYNLTAVSSVSFSFLNPSLTFNLNAFFPTSIFDKISKVPELSGLKIYQASSSEMFGNSGMEPKVEDSKLRPVSPYAKSKVEAHLSATRIRSERGHFISCGILFNHESKLRPPQFVSRRITQQVARIFLGKQEKLKIGNPNISRDWGFAGDYVKAMWLMLQQKEPSDFVIATGKSHTITELIQIALLSTGIETSVESIIEIDENMKRREDILGTIGNASKAREILGWEPEVSLEEMIKVMVMYDIESAK